MRRIRPPLGFKKNPLIIPVPHKQNNLQLQLPSLTQPIIEDYPESARVQAPAAEKPKKNPRKKVKAGPIQGPVPPAYIFINQRDWLTDREETEILNYQEIYYLRLNPPGNRSNVTTIPNFYKYIHNDHIAYRYQQLELLGKGSFGSVIRCMDHKTHNQVAIKMIRDKQKYHSQIELELDLLKAVQPDAHIITLIDSFPFRGFYCVVMELIHYDIYSVLKGQRYLGFSNAIIKTVAFETASALNRIHKAGIIHCDIKPENILFTNNKKKSVKVIDFGCSCYIGKIIYSYIQSRYYRAPEVVLGFKYGAEIDIWSLACVLCEMYTGKPIFQADSEDELLLMMIRLIGLPPKAYIKSSPRGSHYFDEKGELKTNKYGRKVYNPNSLTIADAIKTKDKEFVDLLELCFRWNPGERLSAEEVMKHPWVFPQEIDEVPQSARV